MIKALKKNQIVIFAIAIMLITAGYLNFTMNNEKTAQTWSEYDSEQMAGIGDAKLVNSNNVSSDDTTNAIVENDNSESNSISDNKETDDSIITTNSQSSTNKNNDVSQTSANSSENIQKYFTESRLERENMYSEMLESYQAMIGNASAPSDQKYSAQTEIRNLNTQKNAIMIAENLIKNKGFEDVIIFSNNESISVVVRADSLEEADIAQIQSIVSRELGAKAQNIHISNK